MLNMLSNVVQCSNEYGLKMQSEPKCEHQSRDYVPPPPTKSIGCTLTFPVFISFIRSQLYLKHHTSFSHTMNRSGGEAFAKLAQQLNRARLAGQGKGGGGGGNPFGGLPGGGKGAATGGGLLAVLAVGGIALNYSLFNGKSWTRTSLLARSSQTCWPDHR